MWSGLWTSPWRTRWTAVRTGPCPPAVTPAPAGSRRPRPRALGGVGQRGVDAPERVVVEGHRDEAGLEHARRVVDAAVEQGMEERREPPGLGGPPFLLVPAPPRRRPDPDE